MCLERNQTPQWGVVNTMILSLIFFGCLGWLTIEVWEITRQDIKTRFDQLQDYAKTYLGWPILAAGLGSILFFTLIYDDLNLTGNEPVGFIRTAVLTIGALGGAYGLVITARRQSVLEKQTQQGQDQLFNDRLGRGVEMLAHDSMAIRVAGIKVLEDLALTSKKSDIIKNILDSYLQTNAQIKHLHGHSL